MEEQCPHDQYSHDSPYEAHAPVSLCRRRARLSSCVECDMLLKVIEEYKPGWISGDDAANNRLHIVLEHGYGVDCPAIVRLVEGTIMQPYFRSEATGEVEYEDMVVVDSFSYFRKLKGTTPNPYHNFRRYLDSCVGGYRWGISLPKTFVTCPSRNTL